MARPQACPGPLSSSTEWRDHFWTKSRTAWDSTSFGEQALRGDPELTDSERTAIACSIQQFQLGEGSEGRRLLERGRAFGKQIGDPDFAPALAEFITEEQRHSAILGRFMDREGIPRLSQHWVDRVFRGMRVLGELELAVSVLVAAEAIAVPYYRALRDATGSATLQRICEEILRDEAEHLIFQGRTLALLRRPTEVFKWAVHRMVLEVTMLVVWTEHEPVFVNGGYRFRQFRAETIEAFEVLRAVGAVCHYAQSLPANSVLA